jgi:iron(III) transport system permease protein
MTTANPPLTLPAGRGTRARSGTQSGKIEPSHLLITALLCVFFGVFLIWPILWVVGTGFIRKDGSFTFAYLSLVFQDPVLVRGLLNAIGIALLTTIASLAVALPLAVLSVRFSFPGRALLSGLLLVPLVLPPFVGALGMRLVLNRIGPLTQVIAAFERPFGGHPSAMGIDWLGTYKLLGIVLVEALHLYPIMLLNLQASLSNIDPAMEQAAANLGANRALIFRRITLPLIRPGLFAGCTLVLIWSFTELGTPLIFDFHTITPVQVYDQALQEPNNPVPYALVVVMLVASAGLYVIGKVFLGRGFDTATTKASVAATPRRLSGLKGLAAALPFVVVFLLAVIPHVSVILTSLSQTGAWYASIVPKHYTLSHYGNALQDPIIMPSWPIWPASGLQLGAVGNSILYATLATLLAVVVGLSAAVVIVRSNVPGKGIIDSLAMLPLAVPGIVLAFGYLSISIWLKTKYPNKIGQPGAPLSFLNVQEFPLVLLVIAYAARRMPYVVRSAVAGLQQTPRDLELAASNLGASRKTVLARITVPLILANLIAGALLAFAFAMLEVGDSLILAQRIQYYPITKAILDLSQRIGDGLYIASALGVWAMVLLTLTILSANALLGKKMGAIFRV